MAHADSLSMEICAWSSRDCQLALDQAICAKTMRPLKRPVVNVRWTPKRGNTKEEYEDAHAVRRFRGGNWLSVALADGATETSFSAQWAQKLVKSHVKRAIRNQRNLQMRVETLSRSWKEEVDALSLPWYAEEKARLGAFSSLLAVEIAVGSNQSSRSGIWRALAV